VKESLKIPLAGTIYFTDSSVVLGMLRTESGRFTEFVGTMVSEVKVNSNIEEWLWLVGNCNPADLGPAPQPPLKTWLQDRNIRKGLRGCGSQ
jgi:hypothetical protein